MGKQVVSVQSPRSSAEGTHAKINSMPKLSLSGNPPSPSLPQKNYNQMGFRLSLTFTFTDDCLGTTFTEMIYLWESMGRCRLRTCQCKKTIIGQEMCCQISLYNRAITVHSPQQKRVNLTHHGMMMLKYLDVLSHDLSQNSPHLYCSAGVHVRVCVSLWDKWLPLVFVLA